MAQMTLPGRPPLRFAPPPEWQDDPRRPPVVIAIPNWNRCDLLEDCVESLLRHTAYPRVRICILDQGSTDGSRERLAAWGDRVDAVLSDENLGFIGGNNAMIDRYPGWDVLLLNNDTRVIDDGWLDTLVEAASSAEDIGLVGAKLVYPDGRLQEAGSQLFRNGSARAYGKFDDPNDPAYCERREVDFCSAACLYVKRRVFDACGGFEECFKPCYYEDVDLALKARAAGFRTIFEPRAVVVHKEYGTSGQSSATALMVRNQKILIARWHHALADRPVSLWQLPSSGEQVAVLGTVVDDGGAQAERVRDIVTALAADYQVAYVHLASDTADRRLRFPGAAAVTVFYPGSARAVGSDVLDLGAIMLHNRFGWAIFDTPESAAAWGGVIRQYGERVRVAADLPPDATGPSSVSVDAWLTSSLERREAIVAACPTCLVEVVPAVRGAKPFDTGRDRPGWLRRLRSPFRKK